MQAEGKSFSFVRDEKKLIIPFFQRPYVWGEEQWTQFFDDLKNSFDEKTEHFLGSIILKRQSGVEIGSIVIDGQQRLTTFSLLLKALYDCLNEKTQNAFKEYLFERYTEDSPKIHHSELDREKYLAVLQNKDIGESKILKCFQYFQKRINDVFANEEEFF